MTATSALHAGRATRRARALSTGAVLLLAVHVLTGAAAGGSVTDDGGRPTVTLPVSVTTWRAAPARPGTPHPGGPLPLRWTVRDGRATTTFDVVNVGERALTGQTLRIRSRLPGEPQPGHLIITACVGGVWDAAGARCPGTTIGLGAVDGADEVPRRTGIALVPEARVSIRVAAPARTADRTDLVVDVSVTARDHGT